MNKYLNWKFCPFCGNKTAGNFKVHKRISQRFDHLATESDNDGYTALVVDLSAPTKDGYLKETELECGKCYARWTIELAEPWEGALHNNIILGHEL